MKVLVTGAAGFLGYHLAAALSGMPSCIVVCVDNHIRGADDEPYRKLLQGHNVIGLEADLVDADAVAALPGDIDLIFHLAALNGTRNFYDRPFDVMKNCTLPTMNLVERYGRAGRASRFVFASSSEIYAGTVSRFGWDVPTDETVPATIEDVSNPRWSYAASKLHGEVATVQGCRHFGLPFTVIRYHNAYGPRMGDMHVIPDFYDRAKKGEFSLYGSTQTRSFIYVEDAVRATIDLALCAKAGDEVVNVGGAREIAMSELGQLMMSAAGLAGDIRLEAGPEGSVARRCPDISKLKSLTGFEERWTLEAGLAETARYYLAPSD